MIINRKLIRAGLILLSLYLPLHSAYAKNDMDDPCMPFQDAQIDQTIVAKMLEAAKDGHLYQIKANSSKMGFCVKSPVGMVNGNFKDFQGGIALKEPTNHTMVTVNVGSLETDVPFTEKMLKSEQFFDIKTFPELIFVSSSFEWLSETRGVLKGDMSMHGITKPVAFYVEITEVDAEPGGPDSILVKATTTVNRSEFDMNAMSPMVSDKVNICMSVEAKKYQPI